MQTFKKGDSKFSIKMDFRYNTGEGGSSHRDSYCFICSCGWGRLFINASLL